MADQNKLLKEGLAKVDKVDSVWNVSYKGINI
jgi:hypothetical protein